MESIESLPSFERQTAEMIRDALTDVFANQLISDKQEVELIQHGNPGRGVIEPVYDSSHGAYGHFIFLPENTAEKHYFYNLLIPRGESGFTGFITENNARVLRLSVPEAANVIRKTESDYTWRTIGQNSVDLSGFHRRNISVILSRMNGQGTDS